MCVCVWTLYLVSRYSPGADSVLLCGFLWVLVLVVVLILVLVLVLDSFLVLV